MKVGDLVSDKEFPSEVGLILEVRDKSHNTFLTYKVLNPFGIITWFSRDYIENDCELISESR